MCGKWGRGTLYVFQHLHFRTHAFELRVVLALELGQDRVAVLPSITPPRPISIIYESARPLITLTLSVPPHPSLVPRPQIISYGSPFASPTATVFIPPRLVAFMFEHSPRIRRRRSESPPSSSVHPTPTPVPTSPRTDPIAACGGTAGRLAVRPRAVAGVVLEKGGAWVALVEGGWSESVAS